MEYVSDSQEAAALEKLKNTCEDLKQEDLTLLRFLRARDGEVEKAEDMLRKSVDWRKQNKVDGYLNWVPPEEILQDFRYSYIGEDNEGHAVIYFPIGKWNIRDKIEEGFKEEAFQYRFTVLENCIRHVGGTKQYQFVVIFDLQKSSYRKVAHVETIQLLVSAFKDFESNYPERLKVAYIINATDGTLNALLTIHALISDFSMPYPNNWTVIAKFFAPWVFPYIYAFVKPILSGRTLSKITIFDSNVKQWKPALLDRIPESILPQESESK